jgi:hypothetical protein
MEKIPEKHLMKIVLFCTHMNYPVCTEIKHEFTLSEIKTIADVFSLINIAGLGKHDIQLFINPVLRSNSGGNVHE